MGDTCYSHCEETEDPQSRRQRNRCQKYNERSKEGEYFQCHTDITIPYEELAEISVIRKDGSKIELLKDNEIRTAGDGKSQ